MSRYVHKVKMKRVCIECREVFFTFRPDAGCCSDECRMDKHNRERREALHDWRLRNDPDRAYRAARAAPEVEDWIRAQPREKMQLSKKVAERMNRITRFEGPNKLETGFECPEDDPNYIPSFAKPQAQPEPEPQTWSDTWQCLECDKTWPLTTLYCDCPNSTKANSKSDF